ncbi:MAG: putative biotin--[acetyl-CoA-carboxylase] ligase [Bacteroidota bacterium]|jgi:BirA family biotin operon repressor/biotin-[acetyl-CoA-carboxylase] ligase
MQFIKLDAIGSTNDYLKEISRQNTLENFTTVTAQTQTQGRGQMGSKWETESGKNLIMSVLVKKVLQSPEMIFHLNVAVSASVFTVLKKYEIPNLSIKWPNDILSDHFKLGGILIENLIKSDSEIEAIVGIGLNVNQNDFSHLPQASSLFQVTGQPYNTEVLCHEIVDQLIAYCQLIEKGQNQLLWDFYKAHLFKKGVPMPFETSDGSRFMGIILDVSAQGRLIIQREDDTQVDFGVKEVRLLY